METVSASTSKPNSKRTPWDYSFGLDPDICFYEIEDGDNN